MQLIINEWQLGNRLNQALQQQHRADFSLWLALLSPAVEEMAAFQTPVAAEKMATADLYQQLGMNKQRQFAYQTEDNEILFKQSLAAQQSLAQLKLYSYLQQQPWVWQDDKKKLDPLVLADVDLHCRRRLDGGKLELKTCDETALYDILEQLAEQSSI